MVPPFSEPKICIQVPSSEVDRVLSPPPSPLLLKRIIFTSWKYLQPQVSPARYFVSFLGIVRSSPES